MTKNSLIKVAIAYDFDGTLAPGNMQEHTFLPKLGIPKEVFWSEANKVGQDNDMDGILAYMELMLKKARQNNISIHREDFIQFGRDISFFDGVLTYFERINDFGKELGLEIEHHIISSGLREFIAGTPIAKHFRNIFASGFKYDENGIAEWAALAVNYTNKTQYLFRINKGIDNSHDNTLINKQMPPEEKAVPFARMIYIGDGETDVPAMKMLKYQGGSTIAVFCPDCPVEEGKPTPMQLCQELRSQDRVDFIAPANYSNGSPLDRIIKLLLEKIKINHELSLNH